MMIYFYSLALLLVIVLLIAGCITNNSYTQTGEGSEHKIIDVDHPQGVEVFNKGGQKKEHSSHNTTATGIHKGHTLNANIGNKENLE